MSEAPEGERRPARPRFFEEMIEGQKRQAREILADLLRMRGLMPLLMKHRNGGAWSPEEKSELLVQLRILSRISPVLLFLLLPGSALLLPAYAWWLDNRRNERTAHTSGVPAPVRSNQQP